MRIVIGESKGKTGDGKGNFQDAVVYRLGQEEGVQLTVLNEGNHVTVRIQGGLGASVPATRNSGASSRHASRSGRSGHVRRARISGPLIGG